MKCPKCGYNSFEYYGNCKKCAADLSGYKQTYGITAIVLPPEVREEMADRFRPPSSEDSQPAESVETHTDMFAFDLPDDVPTASPVAVQIDDPFNFDFDPPPKVNTQKPKVEERGFGDLFETTPSKDDPFAASATPSSSSSPGEFDLDSFSWDDTPAATATEKAASPGKDITDDFDSFFGDLTDSTKK